MYARKLQTLQLDMAEFACLSTILLFTQGKDTLLKTGNTTFMLSEVISW